jgi:hypothetical protein
MHLLCALHIAQSKTKRIDLIKYGHVHAYFETNGVLVPHTWFTSKIQCHLNNFQIKQTKEQTENGQT